MKVTTSRAVHRARAPEQGKQHAGREVRNVFITKRRWEALEKKVTDLEKQVQDQSLEKITTEMATELMNQMNQMADSTAHIPEVPQQKP